MTLTPTTQKPSHVRDRHGVVHYANSEVPWRATRCGGEVASAWTDAAVTCLICLERPS